MAARARTHIKSTTCHDTSVKRTGAGGGRRCSLLRAQAAGHGGHADAREAQRQGPGEEAGAARQDVD